MFRLPQLRTRLSQATLTFKPTTTRNFSRTSANMGVEKTILSEGNGAIPNKGDKVTMEYTGWLKDTSKPENKGTQ